MDRVWAFVVALISVVASGVASSCLFCWLYGIRHANKRKLMWRQLKQLAMADIVYSCFVSTTMVVDALSTRSLPFWTSRTETMVRVCGAMGVAYSTGFYASLFVETHLAMCTAAAICRWTCCLHVLRKWLVAAWPLGLMLSLVDLIFVGVDWRFEHGCVSEGPDTVSVGSVLVCVLVVLASYVSSLAQACTATRVVRHRIWHRTQYYLLAMIICLSPNLVRIGSEENIMNRSPEFHLVALALFNLKGLANTLVYAVQSHYIRRMLLRRGQPEQPDTKRGESGSFHVGVGHVDIVNVTPIAAAALEQSERETAVLEGAIEGSISPARSQPCSFSETPGARSSASSSSRGGAPGSPAPQQWRPPPGSPAPARAESGSASSRSASRSSLASDEDLLGCFEAPASPSDVRQGLVWTLLQADGLNRREGRSLRGQSV